MPPQIVPVPVPVIAFAARPDPYRLRLFFEFDVDQLTDVVVDEQRPGQVMVSIFYRELIEVAEGVHDTQPAWLATGSIDVELRHELDERAVFDGSTGRAAKPFAKARRKEDRARVLDQVNADPRPLWVM